MSKLASTAGAIALSVVLVATAACGAQRVLPPASGQSGATSHDLLYVVDGASASASASAQHIVAFRPGGNPAAAITLPAGLVSQDHQYLVAASAHAGSTTIMLINTRTGASVRSFALAGTFATAGWGYGDAAMSPDAHWLALRDLAAPATTIALVDTQAGALVSSLRLNGDFALDALSPNGAMLYLLQNLNDAQHHYYVRAYDLMARQLLDTIVVDKTALDETQMRGSALTRQVSSDGAVDYTLYIDPAANIAFIHALPLASGPSGPLFAHCIDLPSGQSGALLRYYTLTMSADGTTLYAANAALGLVARVNVAGGGPGVFNDQVVAQAHFTPTMLATSTYGAQDPLYNGAALAADQRTLYVAGVHGIWALDTSTLRPQATYLSQASITSLALSVDGKALYAAVPTQGIVLLSLASGQASPAAGCPAHAPWGIAWLTA